jgi:hypothetical protein
MLAGDPPFTGSSVQAIVAKVLSEKPTSLRTLTRHQCRPGVEHAVLTALAQVAGGPLRHRGGFRHRAYDRPFASVATPAAAGDTGVSGRALRTTAGDLRCCRHLGCRGTLGMAASRTGDR